MMRFGLLVGKFIIWVMRVVGRNATTLPGVIIYKIFPGMLNYLSKDRKIILVTGTNGKTTTVRIICSIFRSMNYKVVTNVSGANLIAGIITTLMEATHLKNKIPENEIVILEIDEAVFARYAFELNPKIVALTNLFRDQLDRYGELAKVRELIISGIKSVPSAKAVLCSDDSLSSSISREVQNEIVFFGVNENSMNQNAKTNKDLAESSNCIFCKSKYEYTHYSFGHLGSYECPGCGFKRPDPNINASYSHIENNFFNVKILTDSNDEENDLLEFNLPIPGEHNVYNALCACAIAYSSDIELKKMKPGLLSASSGFGRMERFNISGKDVCIVLVKNPVGLDNALKFLENSNDLGSLLFLLNDKVADGVDISWIWDVDFESRDLPKKIFVSGTRCYDMALRIKYSKHEKQNIVVSEDFVDVFEKAFNECDFDKCFYILPNYTSMLALRKYLEKKYSLKGIWE